MPALPVAGLNDEIVGTGKGGGLSSVLPFEQDTRTLLKNSSATGIFIWQIEFNDIKKIAFQYSSKERKTQY
jgi:hypothetical protein